MTELAEFLSFFSFILIFQAIKDYREQVIDSRLNYLGFGYLIALIAHAYIPLSKLLLVIFGSAILVNLAFKKIFAEGDREILLVITEAILLFGNIQMLIFFYALLLYQVLLIYTMLRKKTAFAPFILIALMVFQKIAL